MEFAPKFSASSFAAIPKHAGYDLACAATHNCPDPTTDVLLIVADENWQLRDGICNISAEIPLKWDVLLDARVIGEVRWKYISEIRAGL